jgi:Tol biopolymer transport system component
MDSGRWRRVEAVYHETLEQSPGERPAYLAEVCGSDAELRREVESLLRHEGVADSFLEAPAKARAAAGVPRLMEEGALSVGAMVGPYRVKALLGIGGMGEVYRARDTRLSRDIVLKTLPAGLAGDPAYMSRFRREASVLASLNHPHIATLHGLEESGGVCALVMEMVEGETLAQRLARGPLPWREGLTLALQAAEGVEAAHQNGIIHRDLKPGNLMVNRAGWVKVLDFGLARRAPLPGGGESARTLPGTMLGTVSYMAPEQAESRAVDERSDIFSFGAVLYEMLSGRRAFGGESVAGTLSAILRDEPAALPPGVPREVVRVVRRCLEKPAARRYQSMTDVRFALEDAREDQEKQVAPGVAARRRPAAHWLLVAAALIATAAGSWFVSAKRAVALSPPTIVTPLAEGIAPALSPDGKMVAFVWDGGSGDNNELYVKVLGSGPPLRLTHSAASERNPTFSPDGRQIAFSRLSDERGDGLPTLMVMPVLGGPERSLGLGLVQEWSPDGESLLVLGSGENSARGFFLVSAGDGSARRLTSAAPFERPVCARFSPDGKTVYFAQVELPGRTSMFRIGLAGGAASPVPIGGIRSISDFRIVEAGNELLLAGAPEQSNVPRLYRAGIAGGQAREAPFGAGVSGVATAEDGRLMVYSRSETTFSIQRVAAWPGGDRSPQAWITANGANFSPAFSPDHARIALASNRSGMDQIWVADADGRNALPITRFRSGAPGIVGSPAWSPDGTQIAFDARTTNAHIWVVSANGGPPRQLTTGSADEMLPVWSPDGHWVYYTSNQSSRQAIWRVASSGGVPEQVTHGGGYGARFSPDGRYLYFLKSRREGELWRASASGTEEELVLRNYRGLNFQVLEDGIYLLDRDGVDEFALRPARAMFYRFRTKQLEDLQFRTKRAVSAYGITLSPDAKYDLMLVENFR